MREALETYEDALSEAEAIFGGEYADHYGPMFELAMKARDARAALQSATSAPPAIQWCAHVRGPDDLVPVMSYEDAVAVSDWINSTSERFNSARPAEQKVMMIAMPALWPASGDHAEWYAKRSEKNSDYPLLECERARAALQASKDANEKGQA
ncbi:MAG: hypothetical protein WDN46_00870 [Methylocella sp.]